MKVYTVKSKKKDTQKIIKYLKEIDNYNYNYKISKDKENVYIPIKDKNKDNLKNLEIIKKELEKQKELGLSFKDYLKKQKIDEKIIDQLQNSYDIVGDIIITKNDPEISKKYKKEIFNSYKQIHKNIKVLLNKKKEHHGTFRTQDLEHIYGENRKETIIKENNVLVKTHVETVFYSTRLSTERKRITNLVKDNEIVGVFFAGSGPFALTISKNTNAKEIIAIELNPEGIKYLKENIKLNKLDNIQPVLGDVKDVSKSYKDYFDRIPMPLPKSSELFLDDAIFSIKNKGIIHVYSFEDNNYPYKEIKKTIKDKELKNNVKIEIINKRIIRSFSKTTLQVVLDLKIIKN